MGKPKKEKRLSPKEVIELIIEAVIAIATLITAITGIFKWTAGRAKALPPSGDFSKILYQKGKRVSIWEQKF